jgi:hypothetical protein
MFRDVPGCFSLFLLSEDRKSKTRNIPDYHQSAKVPRFPRDTQPP